MKRDRNSGNKKRIIAFVLGLAIAISYFLISGFLLNNQGVEARDFSLDEINEDRSQILLSGKKYSLSNSQEKEYLREQEKIQGIKEEKRETDTEVKEESREEVREKKEEAEQKPAPSIVPQAEQRTETQEQSVDQNTPSSEDEKEEQKREADPQNGGPEDEAGDDREQDAERENENPGTGKEEEGETDNQGEEQGEEPSDNLGDDEGGDGPGEGDNPGDSDTVNPGDGSDGTGGGEGSGDGEGGDNPGEDPEDPEDINKNPIIDCSLSDGLATTTELRFTLKGSDYKGYTIDPFNYKTWVNGSQVYSAGTEGGYAVYRATIPEGANEVTVYVVDSEGNHSSVTYTIYAEGEPVAEDGEAYLTIDITSIGHGIALETVGNMYEGQSVASFVDSILKQNGFTPYWRSGWYLERIGGLYIDVDSITIPEAYQGSEYLDGQDPYSLGEKDVVATSGWLYYLNGEFMDVGMGGVTLMDGDEVYLYFTLGLYN